ncbi:hypothetical protein [Vibrio tasmaniensis]|uniref:hypothetical protein n=1 Tax=Vibrio tasmaniensis TaxID=212663 RepID=UPI0010818764|nr:hypothetical protein [Vibrio tasmaniensis]
MKKIFKLRQWLSIDDVARRLSYICEEDVSDKDIVQLCIDGELDICWLVRHGWAREAAMYTSLIGGWFLENITQDVTHKSILDYTLDELMTNYVCGPKAISLSIGSLSDPFRIEGPLKIQLNTGIFKDHLLSFITGTDSELVNLEGCLLLDSEGRYVQPVDFLTTNDGEAVFDRLAERAYPTDDLPEFNELVVLRKDLEVLEQKITEPEKRLLRTPEDTLVSSLGLMALMLSEQSSKYKKGTTANCSQIAQDISKLAARHGVELDKASNLNRDISAALKSLKKWQP